MEISRAPKNGIMVSQKAFIDELERGYQFTLAPRDSLLLTEEEETMLLDSREEASENLEEVREAQRRVGELLLLASSMRLPSSRRSC